MGVAVEADGVGTAVLKGVLLRYIHLNGFPVLPSILIAKDRKVYFR
jgi:hypothetical protein